MRLLFTMVIIILVFQGCLYNYPTTMTSTSVEEVLSPQSIAEDSIANYVKNIFKGKGEYSGVSFGEISTHKPKEIDYLDSLLYIRRKLDFEKKQLGKDYEKLYTTNESAIREQKDLIHTNKIYHTFELEHLYKIKEPDKIRLFETDFILYPNYKIKDLKVSISTLLTIKEDALFDLFMIRAPLFEHPDFNTAYQMNEEAYDHFYSALENADNKEEMLHTILIVTEQIRNSHRLNHQKICEQLVQYHMAQGKKIQAYTPLKFSNVKSIVNENDQIIGYSIIHQFGILNDQKEASEHIFYFEFDLNYLIKGILELDSAEGLFNN